jgi:ribosomal protein S18 acetylase RimI-like enzyme
MSHHRLKIHVRPMVRVDLAEVMDIDRLSNPFPWSRSDFLAYMRQDARVAPSPSLMHVAEAMVGGRPVIVGFLVYFSSVDANLIHVTNVAVHPALRRRRIGSQLLLKLVVRKTMGYHPKRLEVLVPERSLAAQLWLRRLLFQWESTVRGCFGDGPDAQDGYLFVCSEEKTRTTDDVASVRHHISARREG